MARTGMKGLKQTYSHIKHTDTAQVHTHTYSHTH